MYIVKKYESKVTLFHKSGDSWVYQSMRAAYKDLGLRWIYQHVSAHFSVTLIPRSFGATIS